MVASLAIWGLILNIGNFGESLLESVWGGMALMRSLITLWDHLPVVGASFAVVTMLLTMVLWGVVGKLDRPVLSSK